jgi:hypothetical protein
MLSRFLFQNFKFPAIDAKVTIRQPMRLLLPIKKAAKSGFGGEYRIRTGGLLHAMQAL